jgi:hypothetical protein
MTNDIDAIAITAVLAGKDFVRGQRLNQDRYGEPPH